MRMRDGFREIVEGWMLVRDHDALTDRIERAARWAKENGPLTSDEDATVKLMIEAQIAGFGLYFPDPWDEDAA